MLKWHRAVIRAHVTIDEDRDPEVHRVVRVARAESTVPDRYIPLLYDAVVLSIRSDCITITGFERARAKSILKLARLSTPFAL